MNFNTTNIELTPKQHLIQEEAIFSIFIGFIESALPISSGIYCTEYRWRAEDGSHDWQGFEATVLSYDQDEDQPREMIVNREVIMRGVQKVALNIVTAGWNAPDVARAVLFGSDDWWDHDDAITSYIIVQAGLYGEVVFF
jgi:hypothetical protein